MKDGEEDSKKFIFVNLSIRGQSFLLIIGEGCQNV